MIYLIASQVVRSITNIEPNGRKLAFIIFLVYLTLQIKNALMKQPAT